MRVKLIALLTMVSLILSPSLQVRSVSEDTYICEEYQDYVYEISEMYGICPEVVLSIIEHESSGKADAYNSKYGCYGLMQINESSHRDRMERLGVTDLYDPYSNILVGVDYLMELAEEYEDIASVLMHYHGERNVESKLAEGNMSKYARNILTRSHALEMLRYGM